MNDYIAGTLRQLQALVSNSPPNQPEPEPRDVTGTMRELRQRYAAIAQGRPMPRPRLNFKEIGRPELPPPDPMLAPLQIRRRAR